VAKRKIDPKHQCHLCDSLGILYFDYKLWCVKCGKEPLSAYSEKIRKKKSQTLSEEQLNNIF